MSRTYPNGTARFVSMGGAFGSLGSDFSSICINPAGLGVYKSSEITFTPSFSSVKITSTYNNRTQSDTKNRAGLDNMGFVFAFDPNLSNDSKGINQMNIGFGYSRTNTFHSNAIAIGDNADNSIMNYFASKANSLNLDNSKLGIGYDSNNNITYDPFKQYSAPWDVTLAWNTYLIDTLSNNNYIPMLGNKVMQTNQTSTKGSSGEYTFSGALNISNQLFIGVALGISNFSYKQDIVYKEDALEPNSQTGSNKFFFSDYYQNLETQASGVNFKIGAIYTPIQSVRIGASVHTPTFYNVDHTYSYRMKSTVSINSANQNYDVKTPIGRYSYNLETPFKLIGSVAYVFAGRALVSVDVEHLNFSNVKFRNGSDGDNLADMNIDVSKTYRNVTNIKAGAEFILGAVALRAGYAFYPSPYKSGLINSNSSTQLISGGVGYNSGGFFIDAAYQQALSTEKYRLYEFNSIYTNTVDAKQSAGRFLMTVGFRF